MRVLIVKTSAIGDVIQTFPVLAYLKHKIPEVQIDWVVEKGMAELASSHPLVNKVIQVDTKTWRRNLFQKETWDSFRKFKKELRETEYDLLFDLQGNSKSALFTLMARSKEKVGYSFKRLPEKLNYLATTCRFDVPLGTNIQLQYLHLIQGYFKDLSHFPLQTVRLKSEVQEVGLRGPILMVCFGSRWSNKQLPQETLLQLLKMIQEKFPFSFLFIFGNEEEKKWAEKFESEFPHSKALGGLTLPQLQNLMHDVGAVISMDSATLHLCGTTPTPSFSLFGPSSAHVYKPLGEQHFALQGSCPYGREFVKRCAILRTCKTGACIKDLSAETIFQKFEDFINRCSMVSFVSPNSSSSDKC
ncbi:MAG TPA: lipopolysaccharide heptosyltransferase I [Rhabdochlamydiaceae bacterium]|nr:lipopolysaccharide heptosyltransferase I [Rhabdochlamydiaceae bacterium]